MADDFNIEVDVSSLKRLPEDAKNIADLAIQYTAEDLLAEATKEAPVDEGNLQTRFNMGQVKRMAYFVGNNMEYRWYVHEGTGIYGPQGKPITPVNAKFLRFEIKGRVIYTKSVAGQQANPFYDRAIDTVSDRIDTYINKAVGEYL